MEAGSYTSSPEVCTSDHSPVSAIFRCPVMRPFNTAGKTGQLFIRLSNLMATGLQPGEHHISCRAQFCEESKHTANAMCKDGKANFHSVILKTKPGVCSIKWLQTRHILIAICKVDDALESAHMRSHPVSTIMALTGFAEQFEETDGCGVVSLLGADKPKEFTASLSNSLGVPAGSLHGEIQVCAPPAHDPDGILNFTAASAQSFANARELAADDAQRCCLNFKMMSLV